MFKVQTSNFNKHHSFTKYYIINGTTADHDTDGRFYETHFYVNMAVNQGVEGVVVPVSCFLYRIREVKPTEKWSTIIKISPGTLFDLTRRFTVDGYGGFKEKARDQGIQGIAKLGFSICVKHKKPDPPDFPSGRIFCVNSEDEWQIYQDFLLGPDWKVCIAQPRSRVRNFGQNARLEAQILEMLRKNAHF